MAARRKYLAASCGNSARTRMHSVAVPRSLEAISASIFGICRTIGENQDPQRSESSIDAELRIRAGHFDVLFIDGHECRVPRRIAFAQLSADEWAELWPSLELAICEHFGQEYLGARAA